MLSGTKIVGASPGKSQALRGGKGGDFGQWIGTSNGGAASRYTRRRNVLRNRGRCGRHATILWVGDFEDVVSYSAYTWVLLVGGKPIWARPAESGARRGGRAG